MTNQAIMDRGDTVVWEQHRMLLGQQPTAVSALGADCRWLLTLHTLAGEASAAVRRMPSLLHVKESISAWEEVDAAREEFRARYFPDAEEVLLTVGAVLVVVAGQARPVYMAGEVTGYAAVMGAR